MSAHLQQSLKAEQGAALVLVLCMLIAMLLLGASAAQMALQGEKAARGERDRHIAFQAAEDALTDAENDIEGRPGAAGRSAIFAADSAIGFVSACGAGTGNVYLGLCLLAAPGEAPAWHSVDLSGPESKNSRFIAYGTFTGAAMGTGRGFQPFQRSRYIIELLPYIQPGEDAGMSQRYFYRITAIGFGARDTTQVMLQSYYRKPGLHAAQVRP
ncbi:MAG: type IV pilus assembly protein PilX [Janthinobacterium sp.]|jgi:type IV pilus assembly protein PilX